MSGPEALYMLLILKGVICGIAFIMGIRAGMNL